MFRKKTGDVDLGASVDRGGLAGHFQAGGGIRATNSAGQTTPLHYLRHFDTLLSLDALKEHFSPEELGVVKRGNRLSILPVPEASAERLLALLEPA